MREQSNTNKPRWLIVSYYANVDGRAASHHIDDRLEAFHAAGIDVTVLSSVRGPRYKNQQQLRVCSLFPSAVLDELKACSKRNRDFGIPVRVIRWVLQLLVVIPIGLLSVIERRLLHRDKLWSWQFTAAVRGWFWAKRNKPNLILSTGGPASAHVASRWLAKQCEVPLVCEFQDPLPFQYPPSDKRSHEYHLALEAELAAVASALVFLTQGAVEAANKRLLPAQASHKLAPVLAIVSGAPANQMLPKTTGESRVFAHIGTLSGSRNLRAFLQALSVMAQDDEQLNLRFTLQLAGTLDKSVVQSIKEFTLSDQIEALGRRPREALDQVIANADILLLIQNTGPIAKETIPSKAFEYMQTGRPILALVDGNQQLSSILKEHGHAVYDFSEPNSVLQEQLAALLYKPLPKVVTSQLTVEHSVNELIKGIESVL